MSTRQNALYRGGLLVSAGAVLGGSAWPRSWRSSRCTCAKRKRKAGKFQPFRIQKWCCAGSFRSGFLCLGVYQKFVMR